MVTGPINIVNICAGTGGAAMMEGFKNYPREEVHVTPIVCSTDGGGSSGLIRQQYRVLPFGDFGHVLAACIPDSEVDLRKIVRHRYVSDDGNGFVDGHTVINLELLNAFKVFGDILKAIQVVSRKYRVLHAILPVTADNVHLCAKLNDGSIIKGEGRIDNRLKENPHDRRRIASVYLEPKAKIFSPTKEAILRADKIVVCPGSPFTSIGANFCVEGVSAAIRQNKDAIFIGVINAMTTQEGPDWTASRHAEEIFKKVGRKFDFLFCNDPNVIPRKSVRDYLKERSRPVEVDKERLSQFAYHVEVENFIEPGEGPVRHSSKVAKFIVSLARAAHA